MVRIMPGFYLVTEEKNGHTRVYLVGKNKVCSCNYETCQHVNEVKHYLKAGGEPAPLPVENLIKHTWETGVCVVCGSPTKREQGGIIWKCTSDLSHFWEWYGTIRGVKHWFTNEKATNKIWSYYGMTREEFYKEKAK